MKKTHNTLIMLNFIVHHEMEAKNQMKESLQTCKCRMKPVQKQENKSRKYALFLVPGP